MPLHGELRINTDNCLWTVDFIDDKKQLGRVKGCRQNNRLLLSDIEVAPHARNKGIGSRLLDALITEAIEAGISRVCGSVMPRDLIDLPHLLTWYQKRGFRISEPDDECLEGAANKISMDLPNKGLLRTGAP